MKKGARYYRPDSRGKQYPLVDTGKNYCLTEFCRNVTDKKKYHSPYCSKCRTRRWKDKHPLAYAFHSLRKHAVERGKEFELTFEQFKAFAEKTNYVELKGKTSLSLSIDRIENAFGYVWWNVRAVTIAQNSRKSFVPYFNGGIVPDFERNEYLEAEKSYAEPLRKIADEIGARVGFGTKAFWEEYNQKKESIYFQCEN